MENILHHHHFIKNSNIFTIPVDDNYNLVHKNNSHHLKANSIFINNYSTTIQSYLTYFQSFYINQLYVKEKKRKKIYQKKRRLTYTQKISSSVLYE